VTLRHFTRWAILLLFPVCMTAEGELEAALRAYEGRWTGHFKIHSTATGYSETFPVSQIYWWKAGKLHGVAVSERKGGKESSRSHTYIEDGKFISVVMRGSEEDTFIGLPHEGGILWLTADLARAQDYQLKEFIVEKGGKRILKTEGFDSYVYLESLAHIVYRGELEWVE
jgi:hypothetical protein